MHVCKCVWCVSIGATATYWGIHVRAQKTFGAILDENRGIGPGFDILRILLAAAIFYGHAKWLAGTGIELPDATAVAHAPLDTATAVVTQDAGGSWFGWKRPLHVALVPMFFALSGFLVMGSAIRLRATSTFLAFRALRIFPALVVEVVLCAIVLGALFTTLPLQQYFSHPQFWRYFGNAAGFITFELPGVFANNPVPDTVNINLWTLPAEFDCYLITAGLMLTRIIYSRNLFTALLAVATTVFFVLHLVTGFTQTPTVFHPYTVTYYFFVGVLFFHWKDRIPFSYPLFLVFGLVSYVCLFLQQTLYVAPLFVAYCTLFIGMMNLPKIKLLSSGDYSYGIYLYGFPISQALVAALPFLRGQGWLTVFVALAVTTVFAVASWHLIEKPALALKKRLPAKLFPTKRSAPIPPPEVRAEVTSGAA